MTGIEANWQNKVVKLQVDHLDLLLKRRSVQAFFKIGKDLKKTAQELIKDKSKKTGRVYRLRVRGRLITHRASARGEAPANLTGNLQRSVGYQINGGGDTMLFGAGGRNSGVGYAKFLEIQLGRPFLKTAIESNYKNIEEHIETEINKLMRK